jgi:hypothetical protein
MDDRERLLDVGQLLDLALDRGEALRAPSPSGSRRRRCSKARVFAGIAPGRGFCYTL